MNIPSAPSFSVFGQAAASAASAAGSLLFNSNPTPAPSKVIGTGPALYPPSNGAFPGSARSPPTNNADPRVKDTIELCNFAISALKVAFLILIYLFFSILLPKCVLFTQHNEIALARDRLQEALRRLG